MSGDTRGITIEGNKLDARLGPNDVLTDMVLVAEFMNTETGNRGYIQVGSPHTGTSLRIGMMERALNRLKAHDVRNI